VQLLAEEPSGANSATVLEARHLAATAIPTVCLSFNNYILPPGFILKVVVTEGNNVTGNWSIIGYEF
jgi:hypothetical protein